MMKADRINGRDINYKNIFLSLNKDILFPFKWSEIPYQFSNTLPQPTDPTAGSWPLFFLRRDNKGNFTTNDNIRIIFDLIDPSRIDFFKELKTVQNKMRNLTPKERKIAEYWGEGPATKQWTPIIDRLLDTYNLSPASAARVLAVVQGAINDTFIVTWYFKYLYDIPRPIQLDRKLLTSICTPYFPTYPSGHSAISGAAETILSCFFPAEKSKLKQMAEENSVSRLYGGVHFPSDLSEGLSLGRQIGNIIIKMLRNQADTIYSQNLDANLNPPPYKQVIPFPPRVRNCNQILL